MPLRAVHVEISGRVQGVWFRGWTVKEAKVHRLTGWVRNRRDGSVEAVFQGEAEDVRSMLTACDQGPMMAKVESIRITDTEIMDFTEFRKLPTA